MWSLIRILVCSLLLAATPSSAENPDCRSDTNYTRGGAFQANRDALLSSLPAAAASSSGFAENVTGAAPDKVYGLAQCRADVNASTCFACLDGLARAMGTNQCAGQKSAMLFDNLCLIRHSNETFTGAADTSPVKYWWNPESAPLPAAAFGAVKDALMGNLTERAARASPRMFAAGEAAVNQFVNVFGMAQCTRDLARDGCGRCLATAVGDLPTCCNGSRGGQVIYRSCSIHFETYQFYDDRAVEAAMAPPSAAPVPTNNGSDHFVPGGTPGRKRPVKTALAVSIPVAVTMLLLVVALCLCNRNRKQHKHKKIPSVLGNGNDDADEELRSSKSLLYDLSTLRAATDNFSHENKLGEGGFGPVYKGILQDGQEIAVKRLSSTSQQGQVEMKNEVVLVAKLQHKNLVRILGFCLQEHERLLVYEFLSNNSLDKIIFDPARQQELSWGQRLKIIEGIGRGLLYLHEDSRLTIIHRDLKASNILLNKDMNPKISDFGLAKLFDVDSSVVGNTNRIAGTYGYMAPEYALHGIFSTKSDIFSYGVLVLEIITGRRSNAHREDSEDLLTFVWRCWRHGSIRELLDGCPADGRQPQEVLRCVHVGLLCIQEDPQLRPGMTSVVIMLNSRSITLPAPTAPAFTLVPGRVSAAMDAVDSGRNMGCKRPSMAAGWPSINADSFSELEPR